MRSKSKKNKNIAQRSGKSFLPRIAVSPFRDAPNTKLVLRQVSHPLSFVAFAQLAQTEQGRTLLNDIVKKLWDGVPLPSLDIKNVVSNGSTVVLTYEVPNVAVNHDKQAEKFTFTLEMSNNPIKREIWRSASEKEALEESPLTEAPFARNACAEEVIEWRKKYKHDLLLRESGEQIAKKDRDRDHDQELRETFANYAIVPFSKIPEYVLPEKALGLPSPLPEYKDAYAWLSKGSCEICNGFYTLIRTSLDSIHLFTSTTSRLPNEKLYVAVGNDFEASWKDMVFFINKMHADADFEQQRFLCDYDVQAWTKE